MQEISSQGKLWSVMHPSFNRPEGKLFSLDEGSVERFNHWENSGIHPKKFID